MAIKKDTLDELLSGRDPKAGGPRISPTHTIPEIERVDSRVMPTAAEAKA
jgi:hypothetical protein